MASGAGTNHALHFCLTLCTLGLWMIAWVLFASANSANFYCIECGAHAEAIEL
jgi:hypothetical protein